jgi:hypothetical protein
VFRTFCALSLLKYKTSVSQVDRVHDLQLLLAELEDHLELAGANLHTIDKQASFSIIDGPKTDPKLLVADLFVTEDAADSVEHRQNLFEVEFVGQTCHFYAVSL